MHNLSTDWHVAALLERGEAKSTLGIMARSPNLPSSPHTSVQGPMLSNAAILSLSLYMVLRQWGLVSDTDVDLFVLLDEKERGRQKM